MSAASDHADSMLAGRNVLLGVTGSIAAVKTVELCHELRRQGAAVRVVMTGGATNIVHPWALEYASDAPVVTDITGAVEHVEYCGRDGWADVFCIAPATANTVGKVAAAIDDTPVTTCATTALGAGVPVVLAPAMHEPMYDHPGVLDALDRIEGWGVDIVAPRIEEGKAKIASETAIVSAVARAAGDQPLQGERVVVTAGATSEAIDPVRVLTNRASGRTGRAVARACHALGAEVHLVHGHLPGRDAIAAPYATVERVESAAAMREAVLGGLDDADAFVAAAAVSDYTVTPSEEKLASGDTRTLHLEPTPKLIDAVRDRRPDLPVVGFKTETGGDDELVGAARDLRERISATFVVANDASVMGADATRAILVADDETVYEGNKPGLGLAIARRLAD
jgi:phosphopantothenoylcysteine decarboxylase/phosphopantothenate--cysteine ligase